MRKAFILVAFYFCAIQLWAQYNVRFVVIESSDKKHDNIYISGSFNGWVSGDRNYKLTEITVGRQSIELVLPAGKCEYIFHRGDWLTVEKDIECYEVENRVAFINRDTLIKVEVENWKDDCMSANYSNEFLVSKLSHQKPDSFKVVTLNLLTMQAIQKANYEKAIGYAGESITLAKNIGFKRVEARAYANMGNIFSNQFNYSEARKYLFANLKIQVKLQQKLQAAYIYDAIGESYEQEGDYDEALKFYYANLRAYELLSDKTSIARTLCNIAGVYMLQGNNDAALRR